MFKGRKVRANHKQLIERLPNVLCLNLKRFIYTDRLIKMRDFIKFDEILEIKDHLVSPNLRLGIFNRKDSNKQGRKYRLFSVIEHVGNTATRGHYICYTLDSMDNWVCFDDTRVKYYDLETILDGTQAYILMYELIQ
mmetsp:Transcript_32011/g.23173  ORF Transcript_32011/g.23173 Transcript_32011/m.23173 type:complete len:137 (-) Transcript_32011:40-450(-)